MISFPKFSELPLRELFWAIVIVLVVFDSIRGRHKNAELVRRINNLLAPLFSAHLHLILRFVDSLYQNEFRLYAEGNNEIEGVLVSVKLKRRQDPLKFVYAVKGPDEDALTIDIPFERKLEPYTLAVIPKSGFQTYSNEIKESLPTAHPTEAVGSQALRDTCVISTDSVHAATSLLSEEVCRLIVSLGSSFKSFVVEDESLSYPGRASMRLSLAVPEAMSLMACNTLKDQGSDLGGPLELKTEVPAERALLTAMRLLLITMSGALKVSLPQQEREKARRARAQRQAELAKQEVEEKKSVFDRFAEGVKAAAGTKVVRRIPGMTRGMR